MDTLKLLSGGAAQGLLEMLAPILKAQGGLEIDADFGAVGTMAAKLRGGAATDLVILTDPIIAALEQDGLIVPGSMEPIGLVETAIASRDGDAIVAIADLASLRKTFLAADALFVPDMTSSTAGQHVARILDQLGIAAEMQERIQQSPNGAIAMRKLSESIFDCPIGCTQSTEIIRTANLTLVGALPAPCDLATVYSAAITRLASNAIAAQRLIDILIAPAYAHVLANAGFLRIA
jgi:molybdate transport system substrate-binding protein